MLFSPHSRYVALWKLAKLYVLCTTQLALKESSYGELD